MSNTRYSEKELQKFKDIIDEKLDQAKKELISTLDSLASTNRNIAHETMLNVDDDFSLVEEQENLSFLATRLKKFIQHLEDALLRIKNKTYGICRQTGKLISKERLLLVPHATLSVEAKNDRN